MQCQLCSEFLKKNDNNSSQDKHLVLEHIIEKLKEINEKHDLNKNIESKNITSTSKLKIPMKFNKEKTHKLISLFESNTVITCFSNSFVSPTSISAFTFPSKQDSNFCWNYEIISISNICTNSLIIFGVASVDNNEMCGITCGYNAPSTDGHGIYNKTDLKTGYIVSVIYHPKACTISLRINGNVMDARFTNFTEGKEICGFISFSRYGQSVKVLPSEIL